MFTQLFLKQNHGEIIQGISKEQFTSTRFINTNELYANQPEIDSKCLNEKLKGKNHSILYVYEINDKKILIDGHHTVISKILNGKRKIKALYLKK